MKILCYNVNGLESKISSSDFHNFINEYDIVCLTETFASKEIGNDVFKNHVPFSSNAIKLSHDGRPSGGVCVIVRKNLLRHVTRVPVDCDNIVVLSIDRHLFGTAKDIIFIGVYIPPQKSKYWKSSRDGFGIEVLEKCLYDLNYSMDSHSLWICGDENSRTSEMNFDFSLWDSSDTLNTEDQRSKLKRKSEDTSVNTFGEQLLQFCNVFDCFLLNGLEEFGFDNGYTYVSQHGYSTVDYFIMSLDMLPCLGNMKLTIEDFVESDHFPVALTIVVRKSHNHPETNVLTANKNVYVDKMVWQTDKVDTFRNNLNAPEFINNLESAKQSLDTSINDALLLFNEAVKSASVCMVKKCNVTRCVYDAPWYDAECREAKRECRRKLRRYRRNKVTELLLPYLESKIIYKQLRDLKRRDYRRNKAELLNRNINNPALFWREMRTLGGFKKSVTCDDISLENWYDHFKGIFRQCEAASGKENEVVNETDQTNPLLDAAITEAEVRHAINRLNCGKAGGSDGVIPEMFKFGGDDVVHFLTNLFNKIFDSGIYPNDWAKAIVVPIFKKGDNTLPDNYRGISLINTSCKCFTSILNTRLYSWLEENNKIAENQAGFRKMYSTTDHIFSLYTVIEKCLNKKGQKLYVAFIDFKKAFDSVNHNELFKAINNEGVNGKFFDILREMYKSLLSCIRVNNEFSDYFECPAGVRQGCVMSPTLFSMFINQLATHINDAGVHGVQLLPNLMELFILLFADDVALLSTTPGGLQCQLNTLSTCCRRLKLSVNMGKTKIMVFRKGGFLGIREKWFFEGERLETVNSYCYLGFTFSTKLSIDVGTNTLVAKGKKAVYILYKVFHNCKEMSPDTFFRIFDSKVQSILLYSSEVWGFQRLEKIERVHLLACKRFLGVPTKTPNKMVYSELGRYPLFINTNIRCLKYWFRLLQMDQDRLPKQAYMMLLSQDQNGKRCWATEIKEMLQKAGFGYVWLQQGTQNTGQFLKNFRQRLMDMFLQEWSDAIKHKDRYILYSIVTEEFGICQYIKNIDIYCFRVALSQLRLGVLPIGNNMNRYGNNITASMCPFCKDKIEDEKHILLYCPTYIDLRQRFLNLETCYNWYRLLKDTDSSRSVAKFIFHSFRRRKLLLKET